MAQSTKTNDATVKLTKKAQKVLESKAKPFESKKECLERVIMQNCGSSNESSVKETEEQTEPQEKPSEENSQNNQEDEE